MKKIFISVLLLSLTACSSIKVTPPADSHAEKSRTYSIPFDKSWVRAVDWFADHNVAIEKIEKPSGLITAKYIINANDNYLDCGDIKITGTLPDQTIEKFGTLNVTVRSISENESKMNVNFFGEYKIQARDAWDGRAIASNGRCVSTGLLEKSILGYISQ